MVRIYGKQKRTDKKQSDYVLPNFFPLDAGFPYFGPESRILHEKSPLEPDSQVWNRISSFKSLKHIFKAVFK